MYSIQDWKDKGSSIKVEGHSFFYVDSEPDSDKAVIVLIHGFPTSSWDWVKIWEGLSDNYRLIAMDMLGFGYSDKPQGHDYSILKQADFTEALIAELKLKQFHVLAHDYGDTVAQELLARQNEGKRGEWLSLCLLNGGLFPETHRARLVQKLLLSPIGKLLTYVSSQKQMDRSFREIFGKESQPSQEELDSFWALVEFNQGKANFHKLIRYMSERKTHRERWVHCLGEAKMPIALINGSVDPVSGNHMVERYLDIIGEPSSLVRLAKIGHYPQVEAPDELLKHYLEFLGSL